MYIYKQNVLQNDPRPPMYLSPERVPAQPVSWQRESSDDSMHTQLFDSMENVPNIQYMLGKAVARIGWGVYINIFMLCQTSFFSNQIQIHQFEKESVKPNTNIRIYPPPSN